MKFYLKDIADIQTGFSFRERLEFSPSGNVSIIQMRDISESNEIDTAKLIRTNILNSYNKFQIKANDLIFCPRGLMYTITLVPQTLNATILTAPLILIRMKQKDILPAYIQWFINQPFTQKYFTSRAEGTAVKLLSKSALAEVEIIVPNLSKQQLIIDIANLYTNEQQLLKLLAAKRKSYYKKLLMQHISNNSSIN